MRNSGRGSRLMLRRDCPLPLHMMSTTVPQFRLLFTFNNYGHSPAQNVSTFFEIFPGLICHVPAECLVVQKRVCRVAVDGVNSTSLIVFPGEHPQSQELQYISNA